MICATQASKYCSEDLSLIENYAQAVADAKMWDCHHRAETDEVLSKKELISQGRYWKRPASELVFLTKSEHLKCHFDSGTCENVREACRRNGRKNSKAVLQFTKDGQLVREWSSAMEAKRQLGFNQGNISLVCNGQRQTANGFIWRYEEA